MDFSTITLYISVSIIYVFFIRKIKDSVKKSPLSTRWENWFSSTSKKFLSFLLLLFGLLVLILFTLVPFIYTELSSFKIYIYLIHYIFSVIRILRLGPNKFFHLFNITMFFSIRCILLFIFLGIDLDLLEYFSGILALSSVFETTANSVGLLPNEWTRALDKLLDSAVTIYTRIESENAPGAYISVNLGQALDNDDFSGRETRALKSYFSDTRYPRRKIIYSSANRGGVIEAMRNIP